MVPYMVQFLSGCSASRVTLRVTPFDASQGGVSGLAGTLRLGDPESGPEYPEVG